MTCKTCEKQSNPRNQNILSRFNEAQDRRAKCNTCDANQGGICDDLGLPVVDLTKDWSTSCPRGHFVGIKQQCPQCRRVDQYLSRSALCKWCEIDRANRASSNTRRKSKSIPARKPQQIADISPVASDQGGRSVVWVYWAGGQRNDELWYSVQLAQKNLIDAGSFFICGDIPKWYHGGKILSPRVSDRQTKQQYGGTRYRKWLDSIVKLQRIIDDPRITDQFLWMYDDTFVVRQSSIATIGEPRYSGQLRREFRSTWRNVMARTATALLQNGLPIRNYSTHYPIVFDKEKLCQTINKFEAFKNPFLIESLFQNQWATGPQSHGSEFDYTQRVRSGWTPRRDAIIANVGQFNAPARAAIDGILRNRQKATAV